MRCRARSAASLQQETLRDRLGANPPGGWVVMRPGRENKRRRRVLVVTSCSPRPMRVVQRAKLWAMTWTAIQAALAGKRPEVRWLSPTPCFRSLMAFSISAWRRWSASRSRVSPSLSVMKA